MNILFTSVKKVTKQGNKELHVTCIVHFKINLKNEEHVWIKDKDSTHANL